MSTEACKNRTKMLLTILQVAITLFLDAYAWPLLLFAVTTGAGTLFVAISVMERIVATRGRTRQFWVMRGSIALGFGLWATYLLGALALKLPDPSGLSAAKQGLGLLAAIVVGWVALSQFRREGSYVLRPIRAGVLIAAASQLLLFLTVSSLGVPVEVRDVTWPTLLWFMVVATTLTATVWFTNRSNLLKRPKGLTRTALALFLGVFIAFAEQAGIRMIGQLPLGVGEVAVLVPNAWLVALPTLASAAIVLGLTELLAVSSREVESFLTESSNRSRDLLICIDREWRIYLLNACATQMLGAPESGLFGQPAADVLPHPLLAQLREPIQQVMEQNEAVTTEVQHDLTGDCFEAAIHPWPDYIAITLRDISGRKALEAQIRHQATHDPLTGLANRTLFRSRVEEALAARAEGEELAVLFLDLDDFKTINDTYGHTVGDSLLVAAGERIARCLRPEDTVSRLGGDEFAILLSACPQGTAAAVASQVLQAVQRPFPVQGLELTIRPSIGIATATAATLNADELLRNADLAMYQAKAVGSDEPSHFHVGLHETVRKRLELKHQLSLAIQRGELLLHYQPILSLQTGRIHTLEALVRWQHPTRGLLTPDSFIPLAEEVGLIHRVTDWVLEEACRTALSLSARSETGSPLSVSVNLSAREVDRRLHDRVAAVLARTGLPASRLVLEVTESGVLQNVRTLMSDFESLKELGVLLAIDDFGTGYSSLSRLQELPFDVLKIDRSFTQTVGGNRRNTLLVEGIIHLARGLNMRVVSEGVEDERQLATLRSLGCDYAQGYFVGRPLPVDKIEGLLATTLPAGSPPTTGPL